MAQWKCSARASPGKEEAPNKEHEIHEGTELDRPAVAGALRVFTGLEAEVEANGDQVGDVAGYGVGGGSCLGDDGLDDPKGGSLSRRTGGSSRP